MKTGRDEIVDYLYAQFWARKVYEQMPENEYGYEYVPREAVCKIVDGLIPMMKKYYNIDTSELHARIKELEEQVPKWHYTGVPICYETGPWDGKRSDFVLAIFDGLNPITARVYAGTMDGFEFADWYDADDNSINAKVEKWMYLPNP